MTKRINRFEAKMDELFVRNAPHLPKRLKKALVAWMPIVTLALGTLSLLSAVTLWRWAQTPDKFIGQCNAYSVSGCGNLTVSRFSTWLWVALASVIIEGALYLLAYPGLWSNKKEGWNYTYYGLLMNFVYALASIFTGSSRVLHSLGALLAAFMGLYALFQIRSSYSTKRPVRERVSAIAVEPTLVPYGLKKTGKQ